MSEFTKTKIVDGEGGGDSLVSNFTEENNGWEKMPGSTWNFIGNKAIASTFNNTSWIQSKETLSIPVEADYILKYQVDAKDLVSGSLLKVSGPFGSNLPISSALGLHVYKYPCSGLSSGKIVFQYGGAVGDYSITLSNFSFKKKGINDTYISIKTAVDDLGTEGGSVIVEEGVYPLNGEEELTTISIPSNCSITGQGNAIISNGANIIVFRNENQSAGNERIVISGLKVIVALNGSTYPNSPIYMIKIKNCIFENLTIENQSASINDRRAAIWIEGVTDGDCLGNTVSNCRINSVNTYQFPYGISIRGNSKENMLISNIIDKCKNDGIYVYQSQKNVLSGNVATNCTECGIMLKESDYNSITDNQISHNTTIGIYIQNSSNCMIQGNICNSNTKEGISLNGDATHISSYNSISGNICNNNGTDGPTSGIILENYVRYTCIMGNNCTYNQGYGLYEDGDGETDCNLFNGNVCKSNTAGQLQMSGANSIADNNKTD